MRRMRVFGEDVSTSYLFVGTPELDMLRAAGVAAVQSTPITSSKGHPWGVFSTHFHKPHSESDFDHARLDRLAVQVADSLEQRESLASSRHFSSRMSQRDLSSRMSQKESKSGGLTMAATQTRTTVSLARTTQPCPCHACAFFSSKEEEYRVMLPFLAEGFEAGDKLLNSASMRPWKFYSGLPRSR